VIAGVSNACRALVNMDEITGLPLLRGNAHG
jgi:hypothetical protein